MMLESLNVTAQSINSLIRPLGLCLSSKEQIAAKITAIAFTAIFIVGNLPSTSASFQGCLDLINCHNNCSLNATTREQYSECLLGCFRKCLN